MLADSRRLTLRECRNHTFRGWLHFVRCASLERVETYVALFRGVNVGSVTVRMDALRSAFEALGLVRVRTYVQSGNVVFETAKRPALALGRAIERRVLRDFGHAVPVFLKTESQMAAVVRGNPFLKEKSIDPSKLHVTFLSGRPGNKAAGLLEGLVAESERFFIAREEVYLYCPDGYGRSKLANNALERKLSLVATTRNWRTVTTLLEMVREGGEIP